MAALIIPGSFKTSELGPEWIPKKRVRDLPLNGGRGWQSNGGPHRGHPLRALPYRLEVLLPEQEISLVRIHIAGIFALWADVELEPKGSRGASIQLLDSEEEVLYHLDLISGRHYGDSLTFPAGCRLNGDGSSLEMIDNLNIQGIDHRIDLLTLDVHLDQKPETFILRDLGTPASFVIFEVLFEFGGKGVCPFRSQNSGVSLAEIVSIIRVGDRIRFSKAIEQLELGIQKTGHDLDEARSLALTFLAIISAALLELDAPRGLHHFQLEAARRLDCQDTVYAIAEESRKLIYQITEHIFPIGDASGSPLIDRALVYIDRYYAREIGDQHVADHLGLSNSHFRFLFKEATGQPFHKYLVLLRLERARHMILQTDMSVNQVAQSVGFQNIAHFSRTFTKRYGLPPSGLRSARIH